VAELRRKWRYTLLSRPLPRDLGQSHSRSPPQTRADRRATLPPASQDEAARESYWYFSFPLRLSVLYLAR
jgi:hypothetical protein